MAQTPGAINPYRTDVPDTDSSDDDVYLSPASTLSPGPQSPVVVPSVSLSPAAAAAASNDPLDGYDTHITSAQSKQIILVPQLGPPNLNPSPIPSPNLSTSPREVFNEKTRVRPETLGPALPHRPPQRESVHFSYRTNQVALNLSPQGEETLTWNEAFQQALEMPQHTPEAKLARAELISRVAEDFEQTARLFGKIIISEVFLPDEEKTIKPATQFISGSAGGEKYLYKGILYKFAIDWRGIYPSDQFSMKVAHHEMNGLLQMLDYASDGIRVPLMSIIDYLGFRLVALSLLPISSRTLVYGSSDASQTMHADFSAVNELLSRVGKDLHLRPHVAGLYEGSTVQIPFPADIEGHVGEDKRFYLIDFSRIMPPTSPVSGTALRSQYLFRLFRAEFLKSYKKTLSPDAYSNFDKCDPNREQHKADIRDATQDLMEHINKVVHDVEANCEFSDKTSLAEFCDLIHRHGINIRYLPHVRTHATSYLRCFVLLEMIARGVKNHLREVLRNTKRQQKVMALQPYRSAVYEELNLLLGNSVDKRQASIELWDKLHRQMTEQYVGFPSLEKLALDIEEDVAGLALLNEICPGSPNLIDGMVPLISYECFSCGIVYPQAVCQVCANKCHHGHNLSQGVFRNEAFCSCERACRRKFDVNREPLTPNDHPLKKFTERLGVGRILERAGDLAGIKLSRDAKRELAVSPRQFIFVLADVYKLELHSKQLTVATLADAQALYLRGTNMPQQHERTRLFRQCIRLFEKAIRSNPGSQKLRQEFLQIALHQALTCNPIDMEVVGKAVQLCHEHRDAFATMKLITYLHQNSQTDLAIRDLLYRCFNIVLSVFQSKKVKERLEVLDFIVLYGSKLLSLDLGQAGYSSICDGEMLLKLAKSLTDLRYLSLRYQSKKVSEENLKKVASTWTTLRQLDLTNTSVTDDTIATFCRSNTRLRSLHLNGCSHLTHSALRAVKNLILLQVLDISYTNSMTQHLSWLNASQFLEIFKLSECQVVRSEFKSMLSGSAARLKWIDLRLCKLDSSEIFSDISIYCPQLQHLLLDQIAIGDKSQTEIQQALVAKLKVPTLKLLSLVGWVLETNVVLDHFKKSGVKVVTGRSAQAEPGNENTLADAAIRLTSSVSM